MGHTKASVLANFDDDGSGEGFITQADQKNAAGQLWDNADEAANRPGVKGDKGDKGDQGERGIQGPQGLQGHQGPKGDKGDTGVTGGEGEKGDPGVEGPEGPTGDVGPGLNFLGSVVNVGDLPPTGNTVGDAYLVTGPDPDEQWAWGDNGWTLVGEAGVQGEKGDTGATGPAGPQGDPGATGPKGDTGSTGPAGADGADSTVPGPEGPTGPTGADGTGQWEGPMTQAVFDAIPVPDPAKMFVVVG